LILAIAPGASDDQLIWRPERRGVKLNPSDLLGGPGAFAPAEQQSRAESRKAEHEDGI